MSESKDLIVAPKPPADTTPISVFGSIAGFEVAQRMAKALASSELVPELYRGEKGIGNCLIAMEVAARTGASILAVTQNLYVIHGRPSWSATYIIAAINTCGRFKPLRFEMAGAAADRTCYAWTTDAADQRLEGPAVSMAMAKAEGWSTKTGSKWITMPELMLRYRAAAFFGRLYAPDVLMGMTVVEEAEDLDPINVTPPKLVAPPLADKVPAGADIGVVPSSPLATGAGQTGQTVTVEASTPAAEEKPKRGRKPKEAPPVEDAPAPPVVAAPPTATAPPPRLKPMELFACVV